MKKIIASFLVFSSLFLCSCGNESKTPSPSGVSDATEQTAPTLTSVPQISATEDERDVRIKELEEQVNDLRSQLDELSGVKERLNHLEDLFGVEYKGGEYVYKNGRPPFKKNEEKIEFHEEYDDTAVVNAYFSGDTSVLDRKDKKVYDIAKSVLSNIIKDGMTDYEKELAVHDWICENIKYNDEQLAAMPAALKYADNPYGALKYRRAICLGYATTFRMFLNMLRIENRLIHVNDENGNEHSWNLVKIGDSWYHADSTWDASVKDTTPYFYFNMTDDAAVKCGFFKKTDVLPKADSIEYNYYFIHGTKLDNTEDLTKMIKDIATDNDGKTHGVILDGYHEENDIRLIVGSALSGTIYSAYTSHVCSANDKTVFAFYLENRLI